MSLGKTIKEAMEEHALDLARSIWPEQPARPVLASDPSRKWYVVQTEPRREATAASHLIAHRFEHYLPMIAVDKQCGRTVQRRLKPMFPGYLFVHLDLDQERFDRIRDFPGVQHADRAFLSLDGEGYAILRDADVDWIRGEEHRILSKKPSAVGSFSKGEVVRIVDGPLASFTGVIERLDDAGRITVLMDIFRRVTPAVFSVSSLEAI